MRVPRPCYDQNRGDMNWRDRCSVHAKLLLLHKVGECLEGHTSLSYLEKVFKVYAECTRESSIGSQFLDKKTLKPLPWHASADGGSSQGRRHRRRALYPVLHPVQQNTLLLAQIWA